jgi:hypothetical protein
VSGRGWALDSTYMFWAYDQFPFLLGAKVQKILPSGFVAPEGYGNYAFRPLLLLPEKEALELLGKIKAIEAEYNKAHNEMQRAFRAQICAVLPQGIACLPVPLQKEKSRE